MASSPIALCGFVWLNYEPPKQTRPLTLLCVSTTKHRRGPSVSSYPLCGSSYPGGTVIKNQPHNTADARDMDSILGLGRSPGVGNGNPFLYSCLENPMDRGAWWTTVLGVAKGGDSRCLQGHDWATGHTSIVWVDPKEFREGRWLREHLCRPWFSRLQSPMPYMPTMDLCSSLHKFHDIWFSPVFSLTIYLLLIIHFLCCRLQFYRERNESITWWAYVPRLKNECKSWIWTCSWFFLLRNKN